MAKRYYLYYKQIATGNLTVGKPSGYSDFKHNPEAKRMSFILPENSGKAQEAIGKFVQDFQRLNLKNFQFLTLRFKIHRLQPLRLVPGLPLSLLSVEPIQNRTRLKRKRLEKPKKKKIILCCSVVQLCLF